MKYELGQDKLKVPKMSNEDLRKGSSCVVCCFGDTMQGERGTTPLCVHMYSFWFLSLGFSLLSRQEETSWVRLPLMSSVGTLSAFNVWKFLSKGKVFTYHHGKHRILLVPNFLSENFSSTYAPEQLLPMKNTPDYPFPSSKVSCCMISFLPHLHLSFY